MEPTQVATLARETRSSIELKMSAKGERYWDIKVYFENGEEVDATNRLRLIDDQLRHAFLPD